MHFSRRTWLPVLLWLMPVVAFSCGLKIWKIVKSEGRATPDLLFAGLRWDLLFFVVVALVFLLLLESMSRWERGILWVLAFFSQALMLLAGIEHGFYVITGTVGDWYLLKYGLRSLFDPATLQVFINQAKGWRILLLLLPPIFIVLPWWWMRRPRVAAWLSASPVREKQEPGWFFWLILATLLIVQFAPEPTQRGDFQTIAKNMYVRMVDGFFQDVFQQELDQSEEGGGTGNALFSTNTLDILKTPNTKKKNVVVILLESQRARSVTPYAKLVAKHPNSPRYPTTPFLDEIAKTSWLVEKMTAILPHTSKALVPILCGIYPKITIDTAEGEQHGIPAKCLGHLLKRVGYQTAFFQSATNHFEGRSQQVANMGFDLLRGHEDLNRRGFAKTNYFGYEDRIMLYPSLHWIDRHRRNPFFLTYLLLVSHHTYTTPPSFKKKRYTESRDRELNDYYNSIRYVDDFIRDLFAGFKKRGMYEDTIFVFVGDHGEAFGEHGRRQHDNVMWEEGLHIPAFIFAPSLIKEQKLIKGNRAQYDIMPTILRMLGLHPHKGSLPGIPFQEDVPAKRAIHHSCWYENQCMALREGPLKYIYHYKHRPWEIYHLEKDPLEKKNLFYDKSFDKTSLPQIERRLLQWKASVNQIYNEADRRKRERAISSVMPYFQTPAGFQLGSYARLVGFTLHTPTVKRGSTLRISYVFEALRDIPEEFNLFFHVETTSPFSFINADHHPGGGTLPPSKWQTGIYILDEQEIHIPQNQRPGSRINLYIGMWSPRRGREPYHQTGSFVIDAKKRLRLISVPVVP